ncbi:ClpXP protease specificity-enhancing factor SspB, partial [Rickettsiales bacterium]|nr:ClpXP protease specificity-enhancing factor SspB [Rickettsiales bacterium]
LSDSKISNNHCFYITFDTNHPDVMISPKLKKEYPKEITIVIQNQFWDLEVGKKKFNVTLSFNRKKEVLSIPFESISKFNDPFVKFSLQLEFRAKKITKPKKVKAIKKIITAEKNNQNLNKVIKLDKFRKKKD